MSPWTVEGRKRRRWAQLGVAVAMVVAFAFTFGGARAGTSDQNCGSSIVNTLDGSSDSVQAWTQGLASVGQLAQALPGVGKAPGSVLGFPDLLDQWFNSGTTKLAAATACSQLNIDEDINLGVVDGRSGHLTSVVSDVADGKRVDVTVTAHKTLDDQPLDIGVP